MQVKSVQEVFRFDGAGLNISVNRNIEKRFNFQEHIFVVGVVTLLIPQSEINIQRRSLCLRRLCEIKYWQQKRIEVPFRKIIFKSLNGEIDLPYAARVEDTIFISLDENSIGGQIDLCIVSLTDIQNF